MSSQTENALQTKMHNPWKLSLSLSYHGICMSLLIAYQNISREGSGSSLLRSRVDWESRVPSHLRPAQWRRKLLPAAGRVWAMPLLGVRTPDTSAHCFISCQARAVSTWPRATRAFFKYLKRVVSEWGWVMLSQLHYIYQTNPSADVI